MTEVKPGCGCLRPRLDQPTLRPGEQAALTVEINTLTQAPGPNLWRAVVHYRENGKAGRADRLRPRRTEAVVSVEPASLLIHTQTAARGAFVLTERHEKALAIRSPRDGLAARPRHLHAGGA